MLRSILSVSLIATITLAICSGARTAAPTTQPDLAAENAKLKSLNQELANQVTQLSTEKQQLDVQLNQLRSQCIRLKAQLSAMSLQLNTTAFKASPFTLNATPTPPSNDGNSFKFNGQTVYVMPITASGAIAPSSINIEHVPATLTVTPNSATQNLIDNRAKQK